MKVKTTAQLKKILWKHFSLFIRQRDRGICFICGRQSEGSGYHAGHFIAKSIGGIELYFSEKNVRGCCYHCNINLGGNLYEYGLKLGKKTINELKKTREKTKGTQWDRNKYLSKIEEYKQKCQSVKASPQQAVPIESTSPRKAGNGRATANTSN